MVRYQIGKEHALRNMLPRRCEAVRGDGHQCTMGALASKSTCIVHTPGAQRHAANCRCIRCAHRRRVEGRR